MAAKALVLDDSRAMRSVLVKILGHLGVAAVQASQGLEALEVMEREGATIDFILSDWNMPEMNGLEFVRALRAQPRYASIPVVMVTTETEVDQMILALTAGANEYIMKPFTPEIVEEKLRLLNVLPPPAPDPAGETIAGQASGNAVSSVASTPVSNAASSAAPNAVPPAVAHPAAYPVAYPVANPVANPVASAVK